MKRRNRLFSALLSCLLLVSVLSQNALAIEDEAETQPDDLLAETAVVVYSLDELQAAISAADDGDTITLGDRINITENCVIGDAEKQITIVPLDETINIYFSIYGIATAKEKGKHLGRPSTQIPQNWDTVITRWRNGEITAVEAMRQTGVKRSTFYKLNG